jgi:hypothetical protein
MSTASELRKRKTVAVVSILIPILLFWLILLIRIPHFLPSYFNAYSIGLFIVVLLLYYFAWRLRGDTGLLVSFGLTMLLFALALSYKWSSGFSDNFLIGGSLPYKDAKNYYLAANLILQGSPLESAGQGTERPLFPGLLSSLLILTGHNLRIALAILVQLAGAGLYLSALQVRRSLGALAASLFITGMYFYIQPLIGYTLTELPGFLLGCFAFVLLWRASANRTWLDAVLGLITLLVAVSMRAGAFLVLPLLALWAGWAFRGEKRFSIPAAAGAMVMILVGYFLVNSFYGRLLGIPPGSAFGNFSYALYGQVRGGTGWHSAIEDLGTRDPSAVYRAAWQYFLDHPVSLFIGFAKSYRDFFLLGERSIFPFGEYRWQNGLSILLWAGILILLAWGLPSLIRDLRSPQSSLLLASFLGIFLSIPFLPPIDGGARFHASTMPFFWAIPAFGLSQLIGRQVADPASSKHSYTETWTYSSTVIVLLALTLITPVSIYALSGKASDSVPSCPGGQTPFAIRMDPGTYIDLIEPDTSACGFVPDVCQDDFEQNNTEISSDDFYQYLLRFLQSGSGNIRILPALDRLEGKFHYFVFPVGNQTDNTLLGPILGCATQVETRNQSIFQVEAVIPNTK